MEQNGREQRRTSTTKAAAFTSIPKSAKFRRHGNSFLNNSLARINPTDFVRMFGAKMR